jgi:hypothetical protein
MVLSMVGEGETRDQFPKLSNLTENMVEPGIRVQHWADVGKSRPVVTNLLFMHIYTPSLAGRTDLESHECA